MEPAFLFVTLPPWPKDTPSPLVPVIVPWLTTEPEPPVTKPLVRPDTVPELSREPAPARSTPYPPAEETAPSLKMDHATPATPPTPSSPAPVEVIEPVLVMVTGFCEA